MIELRPTLHQVTTYKHHLTNITINILDECHLLYDSEVDAYVSTALPPMDVGPSSLQT